LALQRQPDKKRYEIKQQIPSECFNRMHPQEQYLKVVFHNPEEIFNGLARVIKRDDCRLCSFEGSDKNQSAFEFQALINVRIRFL
jgi:hypothetical protein